jgi:lipoate-protein ligase A
VVRRLSGGGAIVHDREWTYSCTLPARHDLARDARRLYARVHEGIIGALAGFGFAARLRGETDARRNQEFLCFGRGDDFDVMIGNNKVLGSAQRRRKGAVLQHGSLVLRASPWALEFPGIFDCAGHSVPESDLIARLAKAVGDILSEHVESGQLSPDERHRATALSRMS